MNTLFTEAKLTNNLAYINNLIEEDKNLEQYKKDFKKIQTEIVKQICIFNKISIPEIRTQAKKDLNKMIVNFKIFLENKNKNNLSDLEAFLKKQKRNNKKLLDIVEKIENIQVESKFEILNINYPVFKIKSKDLCIKSIEFLSTEKPAQYDSIVLSNLILSIYENYRIVAYHNFSHGFSVMQLINYFFVKSNIKKIFNQNEKFLCLLAGLSHDLRHKGKNNGYQISKKNLLSCLSFEDAVLEKMHASTFLTLLNTKDNNIFKTKEEYNLGKDIIVNSILSTDMTKHSSLFNQMETYKNKNWKFENFEEKKFLLGYLTHLADLNNPTLQFDTYIMWASLLFQEFEDQTISEEKNDLPITNFLKYNGYESFLKSQIFFCNTFVIPLYKQISIPFSEIQLYKNININIDKINLKINFVNN